MAPFTLRTTDARSDADGAPKPQAKSSKNNKVKIGGCHRQHLNPRVPIGGTYIVFNVCRKLQRKRRRPQRLMFKPSYALVKAKLAKRVARMRAAWPVFEGRWQPATRIPMQRNGCRDGFTLGRHRRHRPHSSDPQRSAHGSGAEGFRKRPAYLIETEIGMPSTHPRCHNNQILQDLRQARISCSTRCLTTELYVDSFNIWQPDHAIL